MTLIIEAEPIPLELKEEGKVIRVKGTRVPIDTVVWQFNTGATPEEIVDRFSALKLADVYAVISYYLKHRPEIDAYIQQREQEAEEIRRENDVRFNRAEWRERLLARHAARQAEQNGSSNR